MKKALIFLLLLCGFWATAQQDSIYVKNGEIYKATTTEVSLGGLDAASNNLASDFLQKTANWASDYRVVKSYQKEVVGLTRIADNLARDGISPLDTILQYYPEIEGEGWLLGDVGLYFRFNGKHLQYITDTSKTWSRCYFLGNAIVLKGNGNTVFFRVNGKRYESLTGQVITRDTPNKRSVSAPEPLITLLPDGAVLVDNQRWRWNAKKKTWETLKNK